MPIKTVARAARRNAVGRCVATRHLSCNMVDGTQLSPPWRVPIVRLGYVDRRGSREPAPAGMADGRKKRKNKGCNSGVIRSERPTRIPYRCSRLCVCAPSQRLLLPLHRRRVAYGAATFLVINFARFPCLSLRVCVHECGCSQEIMTEGHWCLSFTNPKFTKRKRARRASDCARVAVRCSIVLVRRIPCGCGKIVCALVFVVAVMLSHQHEHCNIN